jgi:PIN domain
MLTVVYDACILYPAPLRDFLMELALTDLVHARWTKDIQAEWMENLLINRPDLSRERLERTANLMNKYVRDALIKNYQYLIPELELPDSGDRHVLAAAIHSQSSIILTFNLKDFPSNILDRYSIIAQHPDRLIVDLFIAHPSEMMQVVSYCHDRLKNPPKTMNEYLVTLQKQGLSRTVEMILSLTS